MIKAISIVSVIPDKFLVGHPHIIMPNRRANPIEIMHQFINT
ncbi:hypothetical protein DYBT9623_00503 [Dyadobacter sp. CECT 9623]|uniref:Uncharacterized protein n=1 Tax=Dyadobacter linearis TaxID=2823330 RepID=A0ABN7R0T4_9BACT|nr:hypothetical protein DYBT9623_00503 [Dyadobacter sp. CECT 9623]